MRTKESALVEGLGVRARLRAQDATLLGGLRQRLPVDWSLTGCCVEAPCDLEVVCERGSAASQILIDGERVGVARTTRHLLEDLERHLLAEIATRTSVGVPIHAGLVSYQGRGLLLPGHSHSGKSTLVAALLAAGARYASDDLVILTPEGRAVGVPRPLRLRGGSRGSPDERPARRRPWPGAKGGCVSQAGVPVASTNVAGIFLLRFRPGSSLRIQRLDRGDGVLSLFRHAPGARRHPERTLEALAALSSVATIYRGYRGEASQSAPALLDSLRRE